MCVCVFVCIRPFTMKALSLMISWSVSEQINDFVSKTCLSSTKSLHRYFRMKHQTFNYPIYLVHTLEAGKITT